MRKFGRSLVLFLSCSIAACGGAGSGPVTSPPAIPQSSLAQSAAAGSPAQAASLASEATPGTSPAASRSLEWGNRHCPLRSVFIRITNEIRGYPLDSSGPTSPCTTRAGSATLLSGNGGDAYGAIQISVHGALHALSFQSNAYGLLLFDPNANGDLPPFRAVEVDQDHIALAVDSHITDYVVAGEAYQVQSCWYVVPNGATRPSRSNCDSALNAIVALATDATDRLVVMGIERNTGRGRIDIYRGADGADPRRVATIAGPATGLPTSANYFDVSFALATDPVTSEIYAFSVGSASPARVSVFGQNANGNVAPHRVLGGSHTGLPDATGLGSSLPAAFAVDLIALDDHGQLYVATPGPAIRIFGAGADGNVPPVAVITDPSASTSPVTGVGVAVRTVEHE